MSLTENSDQVFLPGGCNRTQNLRFGPYTIFHNMYATSFDKFKLSQKKLASPLATYFNEQHKLYWHILHFADFLDRQDVETKF